jgi:ABC-2 type transport system ATP-binding protein
MFVLRVQDLCKTFRTGFIPKRVKAIENVTFEIEAGEIFGLLGPNGAGKTTTMKCILGLVRPDSGSIELFGETGNEVQARANLGFLSESPYIYEMLTARDFLTFCAELYGMPRKAAVQRSDEMLAFFHLQDAADRQLRKYSKGMLQRIGLAQAMLNQARFLILDEPMSGLDPVSRKEVRDLLLALRAEGRTILFSSHILSDAELLCDRVGILVNGRLLSVGKVQSLVEKIHGYEVTLSNAADCKLDGIPHQVVTKADNQLLLVIPTIEAVNEVLNLSRIQNFRVEAIVPQRETLEEVYLNKVKSK